MKRTYQIAGLILLSVLMAISCNKNEFGIYNDQTMADVVNGELVTDSQLRYIVTEDKSDGMWRNCQRVFLVSDLLSQSKNGKFNIRLKKYAEVNVQPAVKASDIGETLTGNDTTIIFQAWKGSRHRLNLNVFYPKRNLNTQDTFTIEYNDVDSTPEQLVFTVRRHSPEDHIPSKEIIQGESGIQYQQIFFTTDYKPFMVNPEIDVQIKINNGNNRAGNQ